MTENSCDAKTPGDVVVKLLTTKLCHFLNKTDVLGSWIIPKYWKFEELPKIITEGVL